MEELGRYRLLEPIGRGGMSTVYAGEHVTLKRPVAIKVLHSHLVAEGVMGRRMIAEAHTIAALHHPGIVEVLDVGATGDGRTFVVMERLQGEVLSERLRRGRLSEERSITFARQLASALEAAHAAGVVHRDLKPENVFVVADPDVPGGERVKLLDFGISKREIDGREKTLTGVVLGTPAYMAPEQTTGSPDVDARVDVYALGIVMYQMVTGGLPFQGANTDELFVEHAFCAPAPAAAKAPVSRRLSAIIERCLAKKPADRYDTMTVLVATLDGLETGPGRLNSAFEDEDTHVEDDERGNGDNEVSGEVSISAVPIGVTTSEATGRMTRPPAAMRGRPPAWLWPLAAAGAIALGLAIALLVRSARRAPASRAAVPAAPAVLANQSPAPVMHAKNGPVSSSRPTKPAPTPRSKPAPPEREAVRPRVARTIDRVAPRARDVARRPSTKPAPPPVTKEEAFAKVEPPTLY